MSRDDGDSAEERHPHVVGHGPGVITADGCPVELWAALPAGDVPALLHHAIAPGSTILDLGAGTGRLADPLAALGHPVTAVDESAAMLQYVDDAECIRSTIEDLRLDRRFDVVLLASHLVNVPDRDQRARLLATCRRHVTTDGMVVVQRYTPDWVQNAGGSYELGAGIVQELAVEPIHSAGRPLVRVSATYRLGESCWEQNYVTCPLDDDALSADLAAAGLAISRWLSDDGRWVIAQPLH